MVKEFHGRISLAPYECYPLQDLLRRTANRLPHKIAVKDGDRTSTFRELDEMSDRLAGRLSNLGVAKDDRVGLLAPNCLEFVISFYGIIKLGRTGELMMLRKRL